MPSANTDPGTTFTKVPVISLGADHPVEGYLFTDEDIQRVLNEGQLEERSHESHSDALNAEWNDASQGGQDRDEWLRQVKAYHLRRVAYFVAKGWTDPIIVTSDGRILDGSHRIRAAVFMGRTEIEVKMEEFQKTALVSQLPWVIQIFSWLFKGGTTIAVTSLLAAKIGSAFDAEKIAWIGGGLVGAIAYRFAPSTGRWGVSGNVYDEVVGQLKSQISYPGAKERAGVTPYGEPVRVFILPRDKLRTWLSQVMPQLISPLTVITLSPVVGWISLIWMCAAVSPWGNTGWFTRKIAAHLMLAGILSLPVTIVLVIIIGSMWSQSEVPKTLRQKNASNTHTK
jgi:hypothetical protein